MLAYILCITLQKEETELIKHNPKWLKKVDPLKYPGFQGKTYLGLWKG